MSSSNQTRNMIMYRRGCITDFDVQIKHQHTIFMLRWALCSLHKKCAGTHYTELVFLHPVPSVGHVVHSVAFGAQNIDALFFMLGWDQYRFHKKHARTHFAELVFWHLVRSASHIVHFYASEAQNINALFFMLGWPLAVLTKSTPRDGT
jgi:hypothetical protein